MTEDDLSNLPTPSAVIDLERLDANIDAMARCVDALGVALRPHVKTHKSLEVAHRVAARSGCRSITVSTLEELKTFVAGGFDDVMYAVGIVPAKLDAVAAAMAAGARVSVILDSAQAAEMVAARGRAMGVDFAVCLELDTDGHRAGIGAGDPLLLTCADLLQDGGAHLAGVMTHAGESYNCTSIEAIRAMAEQERSLTVEAAQRLRAAGHTCAIVSVGSTPTATFARHLEGVTEARVGVYVFQDLVMAGLGVCRPEDVAMTVLTSVIGHQSARNWIITDAGWMALSGDRGTGGQAADQGYGMVADLDGRILDDLIVIAANQEHGIIADRRGRAVDAAAFPIGTRLRILPNHACATAAPYDAYHVVEGRKVSATWAKSRGW